MIWAGITIFFFFIFYYLPFLFLFLKVSNLCRGKPSPDFRTVSLFLNPISFILDYYSDEEVLCGKNNFLFFYFFISILLFIFYFYFFYFYFFSFFCFLDCLWAISYLSDGSNSNIQEIIETGIVEKVVRHLVHPSLIIQTPGFLFLNFLNFFYYY